MNDIDSSAVGPQRATPASCGQIEAQVRQVAAELTAEEGYRMFRGKCRALSEAACKADPTLTLVRGHYYCPVWNSEEPHWWTVRADGTIFDPTARQFPSNGCGVYTPFAGMVDCCECGRQMHETEAIPAGNYAVCSERCYRRLVGV